MKRSALIYEVFGVKVADDTDVELVDKATQMKLMTMKLKLLQL